MQKKKKLDLVLKDVNGKDVDPKDYFFSDGSEVEKKTGFIPSYFNTICGMPVEREDLLEVFNKVFDPKDGILFYKTIEKEVYLIIVPLKLSYVDSNHEPVSGDFQKHAISFVTEGSANPETLKMKLKRVALSIKNQEK